MARKTFIFDKDLGCMVPKAGRNFFAINEKRSDLASPAIRPDGMSAIKSMADGRIYDGKSGYYKSVSRAGCEIVGYDREWESHIKPPRQVTKEDVIPDVKRAIEELRSGNAERSDG